MEEIILEENYNKNIKLLINELKTKIKDPNVDTSSALKIISIAMEIVEGYKIKENKKDLVILAIKGLVKDQNNLLSPKIICVLNPLIEKEFILDSIIDTICYATKGELKINNIKTRCCF